MKRILILLYILLKLTNCQNNKIIFPIIKEIAVESNLKKEKILEKTEKELEEKITNLLKRESGISDSLINLSIKSKHKKIVEKNDKQIIPLKISLKHPEIDVEEIRTALDLILIIDVSGSMFGEKIKLVKETLIFIIDQLSSTDRLGLISFNHEARVLSEMKSMTDENKKFLKDLILNRINANGSTNINDGLNKGLNMLGRKEIDIEMNRTNAVFFLSDGEDTVGNTLSGLEEILEQQNEILEEKEINYVIHSFGYGENHDENWMTKISNFKNGNFYYIKNLDLVADSIIDPLTSLLTVIGREAKIQIFLQNGFYFSQKFGNFWLDKDKKKEGEINVGLITPEMDRDFIAEIYVESLEDDTIDDFLKDRQYVFLNTIYIYI